jgi:hypothetical protein
MEPSKATRAKEQYMHEAPAVITYGELERALSRCMARFPPTAPEFIMHPDANAMSDLFVAMVLDRLQSEPLGQVKPPVLEAYARWANENEGGAEQDETADARSAGGDLS